MSGNSTIWSLTSGRCGIVQAISLEIQEILLRAKTGTGSAPSRASARLSARGFAPTTPRRSKELLGRCAMARAGRLLVVLGTLVVGLAILALPAQAITFSFTSDHCTGGCGTPPFGTVDVTQAGSNVAVTVTLN